MADPRPGAEPGPPGNAPTRTPPPAAPGSPTPATPTTASNATNATAAPGSATSPPAAVAAAPSPIAADLPPVFMDRVPQQRSSLSSMIMMTLLFFFMSSGNPPSHHIEIGDDGEIRPRATELDRMRGIVGEYKGYLNGTGNWSQPAQPELLPTTLVPARYDHHASPGPFFQNITGWYRRAKVTPVNLLTTEIGPGTEPGVGGGESADSSSGSSASFDSTPLSPRPAPPPFFAGVDIPSLNTSSWNETLAKELRGEFDWAHVVRFDMNVRERWVVASMVKDDKGEEGEGEGEGKEKDGSDSTSSKDAPPHTAIERAEPSTGSLLNALDILDADVPDARPFAEWAWVKGSATLTSRTPAPPGEEIVEHSIGYEFFGLHFLANGTYELYGLRDGITLDIRNIPRLFPAHHNVTTQIILAELEKELRVLENSLLLTDVKTDEIRATTCPLLMHLSLPPLPAGTQPAEIEAYNAELANPTGILSSLTRPPQYWSAREGLGGVIIADQCGFAFGFEQGKGVGLDDFWRKSINYAAYASLSQFIVLVLLVRQMEATRTPSTLAKVSLWTIVLVGISDAWIFSAHLAVGVMSNNKTSLPTIVPGFLALCTAIVFAPRYAVLLHRIQAPERTVVTSPRPPASMAMEASGAATGTAGAASDANEPSISFLEHVGNTLQANPALKWVGGASIVMVLFKVLLTPQLVPFVFFGMHSVWIPQIWRNARRGSARGLKPSFIIGLSIARLALPMYGLACPDNVFFVETADWIWPLAAWVAAQVLMLFAQDRFGPAFFLPKRFAPQEGYDYHPLMPSDPESTVGLEGSSTCSICMEEVETHAAPNDEGTSPSSALLAMNARRSYAVAPCHHLFHTKCLQQWMAIKTICPLCKRPLPPL